MGQMSLIVADFETNNSAADCRVWAWGMSDLKSEGQDNILIGTTLESFMDKLYEIGATKVYFHNLKFDFDFILYYLRDHGYKFSRIDSYEPKPKTYTLLKSNLGQLYFVKMTTSTGQEIKFYDSLKLIAIPLKRIPKFLGIQEGLEKLDLDYSYVRPIDHVLTFEEIAYLKRDIELIREAVRFTQDVKMLKMTASACSLNDYIMSLQGYSYEDKMKRFRKYFPIINLDLDRYLRLSYHGGFTYVNELHKNKIIEDELQCIDVNSLYPSVLAYKSLPWGEPIHFKGKPDMEDNPEYNLYIARVKIMFSLKEGHFPCIKTNEYPEFHGKREYIKFSYFPYELTLSSVDIENIYKNYDVTLFEFIDGYRFRSSKLLFKHYIETNNKQKEYYSSEEHYNEGRRNQYKLLNNGLYGKFGSAVESQLVEVVEDDSQIIRFSPYMTEREPVYLPVAIFTTAYARMILHDMIRYIESKGGSFVYCDTDSVHFIGKLEWVEAFLHPTKMGYWGLEKQPHKAKYLGPKTYVHEYMKNDEVIFDVKAVGMNDEIKKNVTFDNFEYNNVFEGSRRSSRVPGGTIIVEGSFRLNERGVLL